MNIFFRFLKGNHVKVESKGGAPVEYVFYQPLSQPIHSQHSYVINNASFLLLFYFSATITGINTGEVDKHVLKQWTNPIID